MLGTEVPQGRDDLTRRDALRRGALVAGAVVWTAPVVQTFASPAFAAASVVNHCAGCLTGGGQGRNSGGEITNVTWRGAPATVSFGLSPICCGEEPKPGTELQVNAHPDAQKNSKNDKTWHFNQNLVVNCYRTDASCDPGNPKACANRFVGTIEESGSGNRLTFEFVDCGEPGRMDRISLVISDASGTTTYLTANGTLTKGNLQAHPHLGQTERDCSCVTPS